METSLTNTQLEQFRQELYHSFERRADAIMELLDALASQTLARSVVELCLEAVFRREYSSLYTAIDGFFRASDPALAARERRLQEMTLLRVIAKHLLPPTERAYWLFVTDATSYPRRFARTLADRSFVYQPNSLKGNTPVTIGHQYSFIAYLPEKMSGAPPWVVPLVTRRVTSAEKESSVAAEHLVTVFGDESLPWHSQLSVHVADSKHSTPEYRHTAAQYKDLVTVARVRSNRVFYQQYHPAPGKPPPGRPRSFGERFALKEPDTWPQRDEEIETSYTSRRGRSYTVKIECWHDMLMRGKREYPMHNCPFTLVRIRRYDAQGNLAFKRSLWLIVSGARRRELSLIEIWNVYRQRYDIEHFFRFGKQRMLMVAYQTPDVEHEENWMQLVQLAYVQLYLARELAETLPRPWERYLSQPEEVVASPSATQREFGRIIGQIGTLAQAPKPRGKSPGRAKGTKGKRRKRLPVVKKGK